MVGAAEGAVEEAKLDEQPSVLQKLQKWGDYSAYGEPVAPSNFVPMKTPLGAEILQNWNLETPPRHPLSIASLQHSQKSRGRRIGMIIDLSNHETLYGADLQGVDIIYERVPLVAKVFPTQRAVNRVIEIAERFWSERPDEYIAIHCAYGFNRTGFVVCSFLVQACNLTVKEALESFAAARPPGVRHEQFVAELHRRYSGMQAQQSMADPPSLSDLRGYAAKNGRQAVPSLHSDFLGVAEHLQDNLAASDVREAGDQAAMGRLAPAGDPIFPAERQTRNPGLASGNSNLSLGRVSNCESVNNESLDLDEREIYKHFAHRQAAGLKPGHAANGRHRRKGVPIGVPIGMPTVLPHIQQSDSVPSSASDSQRSPFAAIQAGLESSAASTSTSGPMSESGEMPGLDSGGGEAEAVARVPATTANEAAPLEQQSVPLARGNDGLQKAQKEKGQLSGDGDELIQLGTNGPGEDQQEQEPRGKRRPLPCSLM